ncbi:molybdenum ABC transporter ATP-binding protein [Enterovirga sp.]|uniref:molybdenum ABC transporter ATP-binding protein n=1 Tax=Enterovirga sp. TaxID=2026350 RepID=UPI002C1C8DBF|nr:molybdenum ABC transporter ATP-binding protein [Enterovirga sp.]HMO30777.1 molybdenum ABC transporter ATP-binding protein [Enterovirga sp.]
MTLEVDLAHDQGAFQVRMSFRAGGRLTCLFGRSGAGKTTLVNAIAGLLRPQRGRIVADGTVLVDTGAGLFVPPHRRRIGYVFQEGRLFPHLSVRRNLLFGRWFVRGEGGPDLPAVADLLGIGHLLERSPATLSGGEKQRVAIGRALLARPRLLLMDEPLASLDDARKAEILPYIERLRDEGSVPIVYVSHSVVEVVRLADTVVVLEAGRVAATGPAAQVLAQAGFGALSGERDAGAMLEGRVVSRDEAFGLARVATPAGEVWLPGAMAPGEAVRLLVPAREVMIAIERPAGISALNILPARVEALAEVAGAVEVTLACGEARLLARLTRKSAADLALAPGRRVYALVKSMSLDRGGA